MFAHTDTSTKLYEKFDLIANDIESMYSKIKFYTMKRIWHDDSPETSLQAEMKPELRKTCNHYIIRKKRRCQKIEVIFQNWHWSIKRFEENFHSVLAVFIEKSSQFCHKKVFHRFREKKCGLWEYISSDRDPLCATNFPHYIHWANFSSEKILAVQFSIMIKCILMQW